MDEHVPPTGVSLLVHVTPFHCFSVAVLRGVIRKRHILHEPSFCGTCGRDLATKDLFGQRAMRSIPTSTSQ